MKEIAEVLIDFFFGKLSLRKILLLIVVAFIALVFIAGYERITASFRLSRLERETNLLSKLQEIQKQGTNAPPESIQAQTLVYAQVIEVFKEEPVSSETVILHGRPILRFFFYAAMICAAMMALLLLFLAVYVLATNFKVARDKARKNACVNNLRQIDAAKQQWGLENSKLQDAIPTDQDLKKYLRKGDFPRCPCGNSYTINSLGNNPTCVFNGHKLGVAVLDDSTSGYGDTNRLPDGITKLLRAILAASDKAKSINCINNLKQVGLAARIWSGDHNGVYPADFSLMKKELGSEKITHCSGNESAKYVILSPDISTSDPTAVYAKCPIHNHVVFVDGSVHDIGNRQLIQKNGQWFIE